MKTDFPFSTFHCLLASFDHPITSIERVTALALCRNILSMLQSAIVQRQIYPEKSLVFLRFNRSIVTVFLLLCGALSALAQETTPGKAKSAPTPDKNAAAKPVSAEAIVETTLFVYGIGGGRATLNQIRKTTIERGRTTYTAADGKAEEVTYQRYVLRGDKLAKEKIRLDQTYPNAKYSLLYDGEKVFGIVNNTVFVPREDTAKAFESNMFHGIEALLRYKEDESKIELAEREKIMGVEYYVIEVTDKAERKTRFYISVKSFRVMMLTYEEASVKYRRKFYDYNYAQGTLVPYRTVLWAKDKIAEETEVGTVSYGQKVDEGLFSAN